MFKRKRAKKQKSNFALPIRSDLKNKSQVHILGSSSIVDPIALGHAGSRKTVYYNDDLASTHLGVSFKNTKMYKTILKNKIEISF